MIKPLLFARNKKEWFYIIFFLIFIFLCNTYYLYTKYQIFNENELHQSNNIVLNVYKKNTHNILKLQNNEFTFYTKSKNYSIKKLDNLNITIVTKNISFIDYLKGFYANSFNINKNKIIRDDILKNISNNISNQHDNKEISQIFTALFLAIPMNNNLQETMAQYGISHLIAISGFHLGLLSFILYWFLHMLYSPFHQKYIPYRNKKFDILIFTSLLLFYYLFLLGNVPSLLRSFVMFVFALFFLRTNIKILSFSTLALVSLLIVSLFPKLLFSLSLFFSLAGVFYIYLFLQYFKNLNKVLAFLFFNVWLFLAINPIAHFFFQTVSIEQLYSPLFTILFSIFYPLELFLHIITYGDLLDVYIQAFLNMQIKSIDVTIAPWFFILYLILSFLSIFSKYSFFLLNFAFLFLNTYLYIQV